MLQLIFEAIVGDGYLGDIAIDEVTLSTSVCTLVPSHANPDVSEFSGKLRKRFSYKQ